MNKMITHDELLNISAKWLRRHVGNMLVPNCNVIFTDFSTAHIGRPDVLGFNSTCSVLLEIKVSRKDFLADKKKRLRKNPDLEVGDYKYYVCPEGLIKIDEMPADWGLLYWDGSNINIKKRADFSLKANLRAERTILISLLRRKKIKGN